VSSSNLKRHPQPQKIFSHKDHKGHKVLSFYYDLGPGTWSLKIATENTDKMTGLEEVQVAGTGIMD